MKLILQYFLVGISTKKALIASSEEKRETINLFHIQFPALRGKHFISAPSHPSHPFHLSLLFPHSDESGAGNPTLPLIFTRDFIRGCYRASPPCCIAHLACISPN